METEPPSSPMSQIEDDLLSGTAAAGVEAELASLQVTSSLEGQGDNGEALRESASRTPMMNGQHMLH